MLGWVRGAMTGLTALYFAQAYGTTYSILIDEHAIIVPHALFFRNVFNSVCRNINYD